MKATVWVQLAGAHAIAFGIFHLGFWKLFGWKSQLPKLNVATRAILQILNLRLIYVFFAVGLACQIFPEDLVQFEIGHYFLGAMSLFWVGRLIEQFVFLRHNHPLLHVLSVLFVVGAFLFAAPLFTLPPEHRSLLIPSSEP